MDSIFYTRTYKRVVNNRVQGFKKRVNRIINGPEEPTQEQEEQQQEEEYFSAEEEQEEQQEQYFIAEDDDDDDDDFTPREMETALHGFLKTYRIKGKRGYDPTIFLGAIKPKFLDLIDKQNKPIKILTILKYRFIRVDDETGDVIEETRPHFRSLMETITEATDVSDIFEKMSARQIELANNFEDSEGSEWKFDRVIDFRIHINPFEPFSGSSYIPLPPKLAAKKAIINVKNEKDQDCFKWAVTSAGFPRENHPERLNEEMRENSEKFEWSGIEFPVAAAWNKPN